MIFLTKKDFEEAVERRIAEIHFNELINLKDRVNALEDRVNALEDRVNALEDRVNALENAAKNPPEPAKMVEVESDPYWTATPNLTNPYRDSPYVTIWCNSHDDMQ